MKHRVNILLHSIQPFGDYLSLEQKSFIIQKIQIPKENDQVN